MKTSIASKLIVLVVFLGVVASLAYADEKSRHAILVFEGTRRLYGYIGTSGKIEIAPTFQEASMFYRGAAVAGIHSPGHGPGTLRFGIIDLTGSWIIEPTNEDVFSSSLESHFWKLSDGQWVLIDSEGHQVFDMNFSEVASFAEGKAVVRQEGEQVVIDEDGVILFSITAHGFYATPSVYYAEERLIVSQGQPAAGLRTIVFLDGEGEVAIPARTYLAGGINPFSQGYAALQEPAPGKIGGGEAFFIDRHGERAFGGRVWRGVKSFSEGLAAVSTLSASPSQHRPARWGFIDRNGEMVIEDIYWDVEPFSEGLAAVAVELDSLVPGNRDGLWGAIDQNGVMVIEPQFRSPFRFRDGLAQLFEPYEIHSIAGVQLSGPIRGTTMRYIDRNGRTVWDERDHRPVD